MAGLCCENIHHSLGYHGVSDFQYGLLPIHDLYSDTGLGNPLVWNLSESNSVHLKREHLVQL